MKLESIDFGYCDARKLSRQPAEKINTNMSVTNVIADKEMLTIAFAYMVAYEPGNSTIRFDGQAVFSDKDASKIASEWKRVGRIEGENGEEIMNLVHYNSVLNMVFIARAMGMSPPLVLPRMSLQAAPAPAAPATNKGKK